MGRDVLSIPITPMPNQPAPLQHTRVVCGAHVHEIRNCPHARDFVDMVVPVLIVLSYRRSAVNLGEECRAGRVQLGSDPKRCGVHHRTVDGLLHRVVQLEILAGVW